MRRSEGDFARGPDAYRRGGPSRKLSDKTFLIVTEGEKTEPQYLKAIRERLGLTTVSVAIVHPEGTDPLTLVRAALRLSEEQRVRAKRSPDVVPYDEVWVVFDLEQTHDERRKLAVRAKTLPGARTLRFAASDPAFEYWLLLHEEYTTATFKDSTAVVQRLKKHWPRFTKGGTPSVEWLEKVPQAVVNARQRRRAQPAPDRPEHPYTDVDQLVCELNAATRSHLRFAALPEPKSA